MVWWHYLDDVLNVPYGSEKIFPFLLPGNRSIFEVSINEVASMKSLGEVMQAGQVDN